MKTISQIRSPLQVLGVRAWTYIFRGGGAPFNPAQSWMPSDGLSQAWGDHWMNKGINRGKMDIENNHTMQKRSRWWMQRRRGACRATAIGTPGARAVRWKPTSRHSLSMANKYWVSTLSFYGEVKIFEPMPGPRALRLGTAITEGEGPRTQSVLRPW